MSDCPKCEHPLDEKGWCENCWTVSRDDKARLLFSLGSRRAVEEFTLEKFRIELPSDREALEAARGFTTRHSLYLHGPVGCGKSHAAAIAIRQLLGRGTFARVMMASEIIREAQSQVSQLQKSRFIAEVARIPGLCLDDLGTEKLTEDGSAVIAELINRRWLSHEGGLIVTTNLSLDQLAAFFGDDRSTSRLYQMCLLIAWPADAPDRRMIKP